jgi:hypothetical protein
MRPVGAAGGHGPRLDHEIRSRHVLQIGANLNPADDRMPLLEGHLTFINILAEHLREIVEPFENKFLLDSIHNDRNSSHGCYLDNTATPISCTDYAEYLPMLTLLSRWMVGA